MNRLFKKLESNRGESIAELLIALLVSVLGITLFAIMIQTSSKLILTSKKNIEKYSENENNIVTRNNVAKDETPHQINLLISEDKPEVPLFKDCGDFEVYVYRFELGKTRIITFEKAE